MDVELGGTAIQVAAGSTSTCALLDDGSVRCWGYGGNGAVYCWGRNHIGQLGLGNTFTIGDDETPYRAGPVEVY